MKKTFLMAASLLLLAACKPDGQEETLVQSIEVTPGTLQLAVGEQGTLGVEYAPEDAVNKSVTWSSSASSVAEVDQDGTVTAIAEGTAVITADCDGIRNKGSLPVPLLLLSCIEVDDYMVYRVMDGSTSTTTKTSAVSTIAVMKLRFK